MKALLPTVYMVSKQVNGGNWMSLGTYRDASEATAAMISNREFHAERCPGDEVRYSLREH